MQYMIDDLVGHIRADDEGPGVAAFFDFDKTLIAGYSVQAFFLEQLKSGRMSLADFHAQASALAKYARKQIDFDAFVAASIKTMRGQAEYVFEEFGDRVYRKTIAAAIYPEARELIAAHRDMGHDIVIVSSATRYQIDPAARELGIRHILCTELEVKDGVITGAVKPPVCFGVGKRIAAEKFCRKNEAELADSFFYTDSDDDLPLLEAVGKPVVVNPNDRLKAIARTRAWPGCDFKQRGRPTLEQAVRTGSVFSLLPAAIAATAPLWPLSGSKRTALNAATTIWSEVSAALAGITFDIEGEEHLWSHRPAVFIFNHQSSIDPLIIARLVRRDFTGVGKKEIARFPIVGQALKYADVVFIDRSDSKKAISAMQPVVDAIREDKLSVCLAPEGTRSVDRTLGAFKKGAFHIAMQAGAPIVPIVIHNASDSLPKGKNFARPAEIRVTVLPPVSTEKWTVKKLDKEIAKIRNKYLAVLGQDEKSA